MILFYANQIKDSIATFDEIETRHCIQVLRKRPGDEVFFTDGQGFHYQGTILKTGKKEFTATITSRTKVEKLPAPNIHIAIAPTKNMDRFEWFLEKATEFGISEITPLLCSNSERKHLRPDRLEKILLSAMKQSLQAHLPKLHQMISFADFLALSGTDGNKQRFIAHCQSATLPHLRDNYGIGQDVIVTIGPEGDFSEEEIGLALQEGFQAVSLGPSRLRTETAGIAAVHLLNLKNT